MGHAAKIENCGHGLIIRYFIPCIKLILYFCDIVELKNSNQEYIKVYLGVHAFML